MKYKFIEKYSNSFSIAKMAEILSVSRSGYYSWKIRPESKRTKENKKIVEEIKKLHKESKYIYGSPRIHAALNKKNIKCGLNKTAKLMRENNIRSKIKKRFKVTTNSKHDNPVFENILSRAFHVENPNTVWVSDITYIYTKEGWLYLCVIIDLYSRKVIGWSLNRMINTDLLLNAFNMAYLTRKPKGKLIFHSDRGIQYTSNRFKKILKDKNIVCSMSRKGNCWDNACAESFFHSLKVEELYHRTFSTIAEARLCVFEYIEIFYNRKRLHSYLNYMSPEEFELKKSA